MTIASSANNSTPRSQDLGTWGRATRFNLALHCPVEPRDRLHVHNTLHYTAYCNKWRRGESQLPPSFHPQNARLVRFQLNPDDAQKRVQRLLAAKALSGGGTTVLEPRYPLAIDTDSSKERQQSKEGLAESLISPK